MPTFKELADARLAKAAEARKLLETAETANRDMTAEEKTSFDSLSDEVEALDGRIARVERADRFSRSQGRQTTPPPVGSATDDKPKQFAAPKRHGGLKNFTRAKFGEDHVKCAYRAGMYYLACMGKAGPMRWCRDNGMAMVVDRESSDGDYFLHQENVNPSGGYLVPDELNRDLIDLRETYGVFRRYAKVIPMGSDHLIRMRRTGGLTAYFVGEGVAGTESTKTWDQVTLTPKKIMTLSTVTSELNEDSIVSIGDDLSGEIAYAFANKEDECGFNGDGTSTYGGMVGGRSALSNLSGTVGNIAGLYSAGGSSTSGKDTWGEIVLGDFANVVGLLPQFADTPNAKWFVHKTFWGSVMENLMIAAGGNTVQILEGSPRHQFLGYEVVVSQVMPKVTAVSQICALLGDLSLAADFGDRRMTTISFSEHATIGSLNTFAADCMAVRGTERFDINVHDVGNAHATAASRVPGPIVGLITAAS